MLSELTDHRDYEKALVECLMLHMPAMHGVGWSDGVSWWPALYTLAGSEHGTRAGWYNVSGESVDSNEWCWADHKF